MDRFICLVLMCLCYGCSFSLCASEERFSVVGQSLAYTESFSLKQILDDLKGGDAPGPGNKAFTKLKAGLEYQSGRHILGFYTRREILIKHSQGAADFLYLDKNNFQFPDPGYFDIRLDVDDIQFKEYLYRYRWEVGESLTITPALSILYADDLIKGNLNGYVSSANAFSGQEFSWDAALDYYYREDLLLERPNVKAPHGYGFGSHVQIDWQASPELFVGAQVQDLVSVVYWQDAPFTEAISQVNDSISLRQPAVSGRVGYERLDQRIDPYLSLDARFQFLPDTFLTWRSESLFGQEFNYFGFRHHNRLGEFLVGACLETQALELGVLNRYFQFKIAGDSVDLASAEHVSLGLSANVHF